MGVRLTRQERHGAPTGSAAKRTGRGAKARANVQVDEAGGLSLPGAARQPRQGGRAAGAASAATARPDRGAGPLERTCRDSHADEPDGAIDDDFDLAATELSDQDRHLRDIELDWLAARWAEHIARGPYTTFTEPRPRTKAAERAACRATIKALLDAAMIR